MSLIDWKHAPKWANWWAVDSDGMTGWYENKPILKNDDYWYSDRGQFEYGHDGWSQRHEFRESLHSREHYHEIRVSTPGEEKAVDDALGIIEVSLRMDKDVFAKIEAKAKEIGIIPKALMRSVLTSYVENTDV